MATTEEMENEILAEMTSDPDAYSDGPVNDIIIIDAESRTINIPASESRFGVEFDKDVERKYFKCQKIVGDNIDLSTHKIYISYITSDAKGMSYKGEPGLYYCEDMVADGDYITFSWLLSGNVFTNPGFIAFKVLAKFTDGENLKTRWNTTAAIGTVLMTVPDGDEIVERYPDIITQLLKRMESVEAIATPEAMQGYVDEYMTNNPQSGMTADEKAQLNKNTNDISKLSSEIGKQTGTGLSTEAIDKLEEVGNYLAYTTSDGGSKWTELITILRNGSSGGGSSETEKTLSSISATYTGGDVLEGTALTDLVGITVTATYSDGSTSNVTDYSLSGTISIGSNTITVYYQGISTTFDVVGIENASSGVYGASLAWDFPDYNKWSENGNWFHTHYSESTAAIQVDNGFSVNKVYSKPIDGSKYKYFRVPTATSDKQYTVSNNVGFYGSDSPDALTESGHVVTKCTKNIKFAEADFDSSSDTEGFTIIYPSEDYAYYYIDFSATNSLTTSYPDLLGVFDAGILENPLAEATE